MWTFLNCPQYLIIFPIILLLIIMKVIKDVNTKLLKTFDFKSWE